MVEKDKEISVRPAKPSDLGEMCRLLECSGLPVMGVKEHLSHFLVMKNGDRIIGTVGLELYGDHALLRSLVVHEGFRRIGYGIRLYGAVIDRARAWGVKTLVLLTETAEGFFKKQGFHVMSRGAVNAQIRASVEFETCCPASAVCMMREIG